MREPGPDNRSLLMAQWDDQIKEADVTTIAGDRRRDRRYLIQLDLRWKLIRRKRVLDTGAGRTIDVSSGGICFETERPLHPGLNVELSIAWPVLLHKTSPLQLVVSGRILRIHGNRSAVVMTQHEFRTVAPAASSRPSVVPQNLVKGPLSFASVRR